MRMTATVVDHADPYSQYSDYVALTGIDYTTTNDIILKASANENTLDGRMGTIIKY